MNGLRFQDPLWLLLAIPLVIAAWYGLRRFRRSAVLYSSVGLVRQLPSTLRLRLKRFVPWLRVAGLLLVLLAVARPQKGREEFRTRTEGIAIQMCLDRSGSMQAMDFQLDGERVNRLDAVKDVFERFVAGGDGLDGRRDDFIGLIAFGGYAEAMCPQTLDHGALLQLLDAVKIAEPIRDARGRILNEELLQEEQATAIGDAVAAGVDRLKDAEAVSKVLILLSDGENTAGIIDPADAAQAAKEYGIKIYSIGVGSTGMAPFPAVDLFGRRVLERRAVRLDEETLKMLAETTDGAYFNAKDTEALADVYAQIDTLEKTKVEGQQYMQYRELFRWLLIPGFCCVVLELFLSSTVFRSLP